MFISLNENAVSTRAEIFKAEAFLTRAMPGAWHLVNKYCCISEILIGDISN